MAVGDDRRGLGAPPLWPSLLACAVVAAWIDFGTIHRLHHADSLLYPLISLWHWTPFYWGQDRFGMLVPLLARPFAHPLINLLVQDFLNLFGGLAAFVLLARSMLRDATYPAVGLLGAASFLALVPPTYQAMYFIDACYGAWLAPGLGGLIALESRPGGISLGRLAAGLALILLAHWVNFATALVLGPLVVARWLWVGVAEWRRARRGGPVGGSRVGRLLAGLRRVIGSETAVALLLLALGAVVGRALTRLSSARVLTPLESLDPIEWPEAWYGLAWNQWEALAPRRLPALLGGMAGLGLVMLAWPSVRRQAAPAWRSAAALVLAAVLIWLYTGTTLWARINGYTYRYLIPSALMIQAALLAIGLAPLCRAVGPWTRQGLNTAIAAGLVAGAALTYGFPSASGVRADIDRCFGARTADLIDARCTHLAGTYGQVWPSVFHAAIVLYERGENHVVWAITGRSEATADLWSRVPPDRLRVAIPIGDPEGPIWLREFGFPPLQEVERRSTVLVLRPREAPTHYRAR
ncbi:MAG: hypothetical protein IRY99_09830 [Isosphaeraceae bacterium]|nr:hypothetical protein [Isosphaeraceae bacterium]